MHKRAPAGLPSNKSTRAERTVTEAWIHRSRPGGEICKTPMQPEENKPLRAQKEHEGRLVLPSGSDGKTN